MRKHYLILVLFTLVMGALKAAPKKDSLEYLQKGRAMGYCSPPIINADSLLLEYYTNQPLSATGGTPPYTYTFSPAISSSELVSPPDSSITYTITVTGADGCDSVYYAHYVPLLPERTGSCATIFISEYIQDTVNHDDAIELYNPTSGTINLNGYYLFGTTNGSLLSTPFFISLHGLIDAHKTFLIANTLADTALTHKAGMLSDSLNFGGSDIVTLAQATISPPTLTVSFLDEVGTIYPLPTDSGWAVGSGSTKNHTLVRQSSVTQGDLNWSTCKTEWNVYGRGNFSYLSSYTNICTPKDPDIEFSMLGLAPDCSSSPAYAYFAIVAQSTGPSIFNNCVLEISHYGGMFAGDSVANGGVFITRGPDFQPGVGNDYDVFDSADISPGVSKVTLGSIYDSSWNGVELTAAGDTMFIIGLRIQNSCETGAVNFVDFFNTDTAYYAQITKVFDHLDSTYVGDSIVAYNCDSICMDTDAEGDCILWSYSTCYDTIHYRYDSVFTITGYHNENYTGIGYRGDSLEARACPISVNPIDTFINAGTNRFSFPPNTSLLTIRGNGFGATRGSIQVSDANSLGTCTLDTVDILSWSENTIRVKMPSILINDTAATPGAGPMTVYNSCGESSSTFLFIRYNIYNNYHGGGTPKEKARSIIVMSTPEHSLVFRCDTSVVHNAKAYACVKKAVREWDCYTGVNWVVSTPDTLEVQQPDGISTIYFSYANTEFPNSSVLMITRRQFEVGGYCYDYIDSIDYYNEADIAMKLQNNLPRNTYWSYDTLYRSAASDSFYFYDYILHELGHAMGLGHINDKYSLMYFDEPPGVRDSIPSCSYYPGPGTIFGALDMMNTSTTIYDASCHDTKLVLDTNRHCWDISLNVPALPENSISLDLYPNPISYGDLNINYTLTEQSDIGFRIYDCVGRLIMDLGSCNKPAGLYNMEVNTSQLTQGVYLFTAIINGEYKTIKFVKL